MTPMFSNTSRIAFGITLMAVLLDHVTPLISAEVLIKNITDIQGDRKNYLTGIGLVTGLNGTGGTTPVTTQLIIRLVEQLGVSANPELRAALRNDTRQRTDNISAVIVTAELRTTDQIEHEIDVLVTALDDAKSLQNGVLIVTPLMGVDHEVYAVASGKVQTGGFTASGAAASVRKNHPTTGVTRAIVEKQVYDGRHLERFVRLRLRHPDYTTATRIMDVINFVFPNTARTLNAGIVNVDIPAHYVGDRYRFTSEIQQLMVVPDAKARVIINEQTGTVVIGENVRLSRVAVTHANISVVTGETPIVSQPLPFSDGQTQIVPRTNIDVLEDRSPITVIEETTSVADLAQALNALGVTPQDLSSIFRLLHASGELHAELIFK